MPILKCDACGAPLKTVQGSRTAICEYCGVETVIKQVTANIILPDDTTSTPQDDNPLVASIPSCGSFVFEKKSFNIYRQFAELVDAKSGKIERHIDFKKVEKYHSSLGTNIVFKMSDGQKIFIKCLWNSKAKIALNALNGLI
ncbi:MAG: hypothetical protein VB078_00665 [Clostridiaceae bacterium]|nr:hypothetical protein [Clostridiaceae bacterium]